MLKKKARVLPVKRVHRNEKITPEGERLCPICGETMLVEIISHIHVDCCPEHGVWLDNGELEKLFAKLEVKLRSESRRKIHAARIEGKIKGSVLGGFSFFVN